MSGDMMQYIIIVLVPIAISLVSLVFSVRNSRKNDGKQNYLEQDKQYSKLLQIAITNPELRDYKTITQKFKENDKQFITRYNTYAYLVWNCMETMYDLSTREHLFNRKQVVDDTWLPVIIEENKIHHHWFQKNQRLFKKEFQEYINGMNDVSIKQGDAGDLGDIYPLMCKLFPAGELKTEEKLKDLLSKKKYVLYVMRNPMLKGEEGILGFCFVYLVPEYKSLWLDYMAINPMYQDFGYGTLLFNNIASTAGGGNQNIFLELEIPQSKNTSALENRRITFYKRQGVCLLDVDYELPTPTGSLPMFLAFKPANSISLLTEEMLRGVIGEVLSNVHDDLESMPSVRKKVLGRIKEIKINKEA